MLMLSLLMLLLLLSLLMLSLLLSLFLLLLCLLRPSLRFEISTTLLLRKSLNFSKISILWYISFVLCELIHVNISSGSLLNLFNPQHPLCITPHGFIESTPKSFLEWINNITQWFNSRKKETNKFTEQKDVNKDNRTVKKTAIIPNAPNNY